MSSLGQLVSPAQPATHWCVVVLQTSGAVQSPLPMHPTHVFDTESHFGVVPLQVVPSTHPTHCPTFAPVVTHAGPPVVPVQSAALVHPWQTWVVVLHVGALPAQSVFALQPTHVPLGASQTCDPPVHCVTLPSEHCPHAPDAWQAGVAPPQSASLAHFPQIWLDPHTGVVPPQSPAVRQPTQLLTVVSQRGVAPLQLASLAHVTHAPKFVLATLSQTSPPEHSALSAQARQAWLVESHTGFVPLQSVLAKHPRHTLRTVSHFDVLPLQFALLVHATHCPCFDPLSAHAGVVPEHSVSAAHARQVRVVESQAGVTIVPAQSLFEMQTTHAFNVVSQTRPPVQCALTVQNPPRGDVALTPLPPAVAPLATPPVVSPAAPPATTGVQFDAMDAPCT